MKWTKDPKVAMHRLAAVLGWTVRSTGRAWEVTNLPHAEGLKYNPVSLLGFMTRVAMAPPRIGGLGMTGFEIQEAIRFHPKHIFNNKRFRWYLDLGRKISATDESTMYAAYLNPEREEERRAS